jgi:protein-S-isoprenylcysteine O-methyltransferase Ste14
LEEHIVNAVLILLAVAGFGFVHSLTAGDSLKRLLERAFGERFAEGWQRFAYNGISVITLVPSLLLLMLLPDHVLYRVPPPYLWLAIGVQGIGIIGFLWGLLLVDVWRLAGIRQVLAYLSGDKLPLPPEPLQERGIYAVVRHPLYFFGLLMLWSTPVMTLNIVMLNVGATIYLIVGSLIEERRLLRAYGERYRQYCERVPWLVPCNFWK